MFDKHQGLLIFVVVGMIGIQQRVLRKIREMNRKGKRKGTTDYSILIPRDFVSSNIIAYNRNKRIVVMTWEGSTLTINFLEQ